MDIKKKIINDLALGYICSRNFHIELAMTWYAEKIAIRFAAWKEQNPQPKPLEDLYKLFLEEEKKLGVIS